MIRAKAAPRRRAQAKRTLRGPGISDRLLEVELATVGALRSLQMDLDNDAGLPVETALRDARSMLKKRKLSCTVWPDWS